MGLSNSVNSYEDLIPVLDQALAAARGIRIDARTPGRAVHMRQRMYKLRSLMREKSTEIYEVGHPQRGTCAWDNLTVEITPGDTFLYIRKIEAPLVEEL